jgi:hypothetical protein
MMKTRKAQSQNEGMGDISGDVRGEEGDAQMERIWGGGKVRSKRHEQEK